MNRFDGTAARQLDLIDLTEPIRPSAPSPISAPPVRRDFRLLKQDVYAALDRRRRRAQIAARHALERAQDA